MTQPATSSPSSAPRGRSLRELATSLGAVILTHPERAGARVARLAAAARVSDLLAQVGAATLIVTDLMSPHLVRIAELLDVPGLCLVGGGAPGPALIAAAAAGGKVLLVAPGGLAETCARLCACGLALAVEPPAAPPAGPGDGDGR
ncbi:MAG TPA: hypothetical protein VGQ83_06545 [Polyangia bacterium]|jgi:hypothetical protein